MTPMVDLAFLLVTFFMLISEFRADEAAEIDIPSSISDLKIPDKDVLTLIIDRDDRVFFNITGQEERKRVLELMADKYEIQFTDEQKNEFANMSSFGVPMKELKGFLDANSTDRRHLVDRLGGIPSDSTNCELCNWIYFARRTAPKFRVAIKGDQESSFPAVKQVMDYLQSDAIGKVNKFNLITNMEGAPSVASH